MQVTPDDQRKKGNQVYSQSITENQQKRVGNRVGNEIGGGRKLLVSKSLNVR